MCPGSALRVIARSIAAFLLFLGAAACRGSDASPATPAVAVQSPDVSSSNTPVPTSTLAPSATHSPSPTCTTTPAPTRTPTPFLPLALQKIVPDNAAALQRLAWISPQTPPYFMLHTVLFSPDRRKLALQFAFYGSRDRNREAYFEVWSLESGQRLFEGAHRTYPAYIAFLPDGDLLLIPVDSNRAYRLDAENGERKGSFLLPAHDDIVALAPQSERLVLGERREGYALLHLFDIAATTEVGNYRVPGFLLSVSLAEPYLAVITSSNRFVPYTRVLLLGDAGLREVRMLRGGAYFLASAPLLVLEKDTSIAVLDVRDGSMISFPRGTCYGARPALSPDGRLFIISRGDKCRQMEVAASGDGETLAVLNVGPHWNRSLFSPDGRMLAVWYENDTRLSLWGITSP